MLMNESTSQPKRKFVRLSRPAAGPARAIVPLKRTLQRHNTARLQIASDPVQPSAYAGYERILTADGGVRIAYRNVDMRWRHTIRRVLVWTACTVLGGWLLLYHEPQLSAALNFLCLIALATVT